MAEPGDEITTAARGHSRLRVSHADREQVIEVLKVAFVQERLDRDEFGLRVGRALASRTYADLAALTADIPVRPTGAQPPEPVTEPVNKKAVVAVACATTMLVGVYRVALMTPDGSPAALPIIVATLVLLLVAPTGWLLLFHAWLDKRGGRQSPRVTSGPAATRRPTALPRPVPGRSW